MHTLDQIEKMFAEMGLGSEPERVPSLKLGQMAQESQQLRKVTFIITTANTVLEEESEDGKLERNPQ
jgi:hypothetical protein